MAEILDAGTGARHNGANEAALALEIDGLIDVVRTPGNADRYPLAWGSL